MKIGHLNEEDVAIMNGCYRDGDGVLRGSDDKRILSADVRAVCKAAMQPALPVLSIRIVRLDMRKDAITIVTALPDVYPFAISGDEHLMVQFDSPRSQTVEWIETHFPDTPVEYTDARIDRTLSYPNIPARWVDMMAGAQRRTQES